MYFELSEDQGAVLHGLKPLLQRLAGVDRARIFANGSTFDDELFQALASSGYLDIALTAEHGLLTAALVAESVSRAAGVLPVGECMLVAPMFMQEHANGPVAIAHSPEVSFVRHAPFAAAILTIVGDNVVAVHPQDGEVEPVPSTFGVPVGRVPSTAWSRGEVVAEGQAGAFLAHWRVAIAVEISSLLAEALDMTAEYLKRRRQFGRPIADFQAVQHRLANCCVLVEGSAWLAREAAWLGASSYHAATAAAHAAMAAQHVVDELHQLSGAIGFTEEYGLHIWTMRARGLALEAGGVNGHSRAVAQGRKGSTNAPQG